MRFFGQQFRKERCLSARLASTGRAWKPLLLLPGFALFSLPVQAQTAPYVLPYTMSTYAGPHATYTPGAPCATNSALVALNASGDGCPAASVSVGGDPHDIRVDARGNVYYIDNGSKILIHKISPQTGQQTVYTGNRICSNYADTYGDGCPANDGAANNNTAVLPTDDKLKAQRGLAIAPNGDLYSAGYNDYEIHRISAANGVMSLVAGTGSSNTTTFSGPLATTGLGSTRGVGVDAAGNVFIADTANNILQEVPVTGAQAGQIVALTAPNAAGAKTVTSGVAAGTALLNAPEDVQIDSNGNIYIADFGNNIVRAIYSGKGTLPGISNPVAGYIYTVAGGLVIATGATNTSYPGDGSTPTMSATSIALTVRKIALDALNNLYIADSGNNVVWFVDNTTGYIRVLAGRFGQTGSTTPAFVCNPGNGSVGDGCPGSSASLYSAADMGVHPDNQGNLYITDAEGGNAGLSRIRKLLSGLNFPATNVATPLTQTVLIHFAAGDTPAASTPFAINSPAFTVGAAACTATTGPNADGTDDCLAPVTFNPTLAGYQTATLTITSTKGATGTYQLTGTGTGPSFAIDPGYLTAFNTSVSNAQGVTSDLAGNLFIVDTGHNRVLRYNATTATTTVFAGTGTAGLTGDNGPATAATLKAPTAAAVDASGNVYITDTGNNVVRRVTPAGIISTFAGGGSTCSASTNACLATQTSLAGPTGIATDSFGQVYVSDSGNNVIRQISNNGFIFTLAGGGSGGACSTDPKVTPHAVDTQNDGCAGLQGIFSSPAGLAYDAVGNFLVVADSGNNIVRKLYLANTIVVTNTSVGTAVVNPLTLVAGNGQAGTSLASDGAATKSQLSAPRGIALDAAENTYIADTGNGAVRFVNNTTGGISTIAGLLGTSGNGALPGNANAVQLSSPSAIAVTAGNNLYIADSGNSRILVDNRSQVTYNFGLVGQGISSPAVVFTETNTGNALGTLPSPLYSRTGSGDFTLNAATASGCSAGGSLDIDAACVLSGVFTPGTLGAQSATFAESGALPFNAPSLTLIGVGAPLTKTNSALAQTSPATGNARFGDGLTLTATVTAQVCDSRAPACYPTGTVTFTVDGATFGAPATLGTPSSTTSTAATASQVITGLSAGTHLASCFYSGDNFYGGSSCGSFTVTIAQASTTSILTAATTGKPQFPGVGCFVIPQKLPNEGFTQCIGQVLTAVVASNTSGVPTGTVTFSSGVTTLGTASVDSNGIATLALTYLIDLNGRIARDNSLPPGNFSLTCTYNGEANFASSKCAPVPFTVLPQTPGFTLTPRGCALANLPQGQEQTPCSNGTATSVGNGDTLINGYPVVATADGATTDATIFINPTNTLSGPIKIGCSGLPQYSICTFSPSVASLVAGTTYAAPFPIDVTLWTDIRPGNATSALRKPDLGPGHDGTHGSMLAMLLGWPVTLFGLAVVIRSRRRGARILPWLATLLVMVGSAAALTGCGLGGPGVDKVVLTPAGTYPITITVAVGGVTQTTTVYFKVGSPGITGQQ